MWSAPVIENFMKTRGGTYIIIIMDYVVLHMYFLYNPVNSHVTLLANIIEGPFCVMNWMGAPWDQELPRPTHRGPSEGPAGPLRVRLWVSPPDHELSLYRCIHDVV